MVPINDYYRPITHTEYTRPKRSWWFATYLAPQISEEPYFTLGTEKVEQEKSNFVHVTDNYLTRALSPKTGPRIGGGIALVIIIYFSFVFYMGGDWDIMATIIYIICCFFVVFYTAYYFTMPEKEQIINRREGTITFTGFMWADNITMDFDNVRITQGGGMTGTSPTSYWLAVERPDRFGTRAPFNMGGAALYGDLSFLTWYMDKNRPLPPGSAFDPYRKRDFERRKAEGFPPPKYASFVPTPEATPAQQAEREQYWRDGYSTNADGERVWHVVKGPKYQAPSQ